MPRTTELLGKALQETSKTIASAQILRPSPVIVEPPIVAEVTRDKSLPEGHYLSIPKIGVDTVIWEAPSENYEQVLRKGVWRVPDFSDPITPLPGKPMILAAHRFGYLEWTQSFRLKNSFYKLPSLKEGDKIEVVWDQHRYNYLVTKVKEGTEIDDYSSDLILYTCKFLVSPVRIFVYAKLVK